MSWLYIIAARAGTIDEKGHLSLTEAPMRIPAHEMLFIGQDRCPEFDCSQTLPKDLDILLCLLDGAERRLQLQAKLNAVCHDLGQTGALPVWKSRGCRSRSLSKC